MSLVNYVSDWVTILSDPMPLAILKLPMIWLSSASIAKSSKRYLTKFEFALEYILLLEFFVKIIFTTVSLIISPLTIESIPILVMISSMALSLPISYAAFVVFVRRRIGNFCESIKWVSFKLALVLAIVP